MVMRNNGYCKGDELCRFYNATQARSRYLSLVTVLSSQELTLCLLSADRSKVPAYAFIEPVQFCCRSGVLSHIPVCFVLPDSL